MISSNPRTSEPGRAPWAGKDTEWSKSLFSGGGELKPTREGKTVAEQALEPTRAQVS